MHPTMSQPSYTEGRNKQTIIYGLRVTINRDHFPNNLVYIKITTNRDHRRPYFSTEYGLLRSLSVVIFMYGRLLQKWSLFIVPRRPYIMVSMAQ